MNPLTTLRASPSFQEDFARLQAVTLDPARHTSPDAAAHSAAVARRARRLALLNGRAPEEADLLEAAGLVHDIGKLGGTTSASASVERLPRYGEVAPALEGLVRYHDVNLPWFLAATAGRGDPPSERAWRRLISRVDPALLALLMVADRVDCPGGWRANRPLGWFLEELERRSPATAGLRLDVDGEEAR